MAEMSDRDWEALHENFDTAELLTRGQFPRRLARAI